jgi:hypothetical protein
MIAESHCLDRGCHMPVNVILIMMRTVIYEWERRAAFGICVDEGAESFL